MAGCSSSSYSSSSQSHKIGSQFNQSTESMLLNLLSRLDLARQRTIERQRKRFGRYQPLTLSMMQYELKTFELWRSIIAECLASFLYVFLLCSTHLTWTGSNFIFGSQPNWLIISLCSGFTMATLIQCFGHISGGHINPSVTVSFLFTKRISPLRAIMYILAHCCGAIAGAALLYGVTVTNNQQTIQSMGPLGITTGHDSLNVWQLLCIEFILTFLVVFTTYATIDTNRKSFGSDSLSIGLAYLVASLTGLPASGASMNPARTLGPAFVMNRWQHHWVYWVGPLSGAIIAAIIYEFIFDTRKLSKKFQRQQQQLYQQQQQQQQQSTHLGIGFGGLGGYGPNGSGVVGLVGTGGGGGGGPGVIGLGHPTSTSTNNNNNVLHHRSTTLTGKSPLSTTFFQDHFVDFDIERDSNVDDDYEDPELASATAKMTLHPQHHQHHKLYPPTVVATTGVGVGGIVGGVGSTSAASSGSSSGHSRSNHTQHSIVSVHGSGGQGTNTANTNNNSNNNGGGGVPFESYRPMIGPFGSSQISAAVVGANHEISSTTQIYNEPTNGSNYYQSASDRSANQTSSSGGSNGTNNGQQQQPPTSSSTFFHPDRRTPGAGGGGGGGGVNNATTTTLRSTSNSTPLNHRHLSYEQQQHHHQSVIGPKF